MRSSLIAVAVLIAAFMGGYWLGRGSTKTEKVTEVVKTDTVYFEKPTLVATTVRPITVPRLVFVPSATTEHTSEVDSSFQPLPNWKELDSLTMEYQTKTYQDSTYTAQVSGLAYAGYEPTLDWVHTYNTTRTITQTVTKRHRFAVTAGVGAAYTPQGIQPTVGVQVGVVLWGW